MIGWWRRWRSRRWLRRQGWTEPQAPKADHYGTFWNTYLDTEEER